MYYTSDEEFWCDVHTRFGLSIADIARQARQGTGIQQRALEKRVERGITTVRVKRAKMDENYG
jgi:hypothetical protein